MNDMNDFAHPQSVPPASLRPELAERFLSAMQAVAAEEGGDVLEARLRRLRPAPMGQVRSQRWLASMQHAQRSHAIPAGRRGWWQPWSAAAALVALCTVGSILMLSSHAHSSAPAGLAYRCVLDSHAEGAIQWKEGQIAMRPCHVLYEDSFILDGDEDSLITVRVPVRSHVMIEEEVI